MSLLTLYHAQKNKITNPVVLELHSSLWASERRFGFRGFRASGWSDTLPWWCWDSFILMFLHDACVSDFGGGQSLSPSRVGRMWCRLRRYKPVPVVTTYDLGCFTGDSTRAGVHTLVTASWMRTACCGASGGSTLADRSWNIFCIPCLCCSRAALSPLLWVWRMLLVRVGGRLDLYPRQFRSAVQTVMRYCGPEE